MDNSRSLSWIWVLIWVLVCLLDGVSRSSFPCTFPFWFHRLVGRVMQHFKNQIPEIKSGNSIHAWSDIKRNNFRFRRNVWDWKLFLAHPTYVNKRVISKCTQDSYRGRFWVFKIPGNIRVLKQSQPVLLCNVSRMTMLLEFTRVVCV